MNVVAIRFHLNGQVEIKTDLQADWQNFVGVVVNVAEIERQEQLNSRRIRDHENKVRRKRTRDLHKAYRSIPF